ncbi:UDP-glucose/GDP-mannose dehydrogenase family protein [bacterium]|nr:MAG: UDP-glucose/GDP-mannose dehydrogenase family protein [bacterium]
MASIGIIGGGVVGGAVKNFFRQAKVYDKYKPLDKIEEVGRARFIFICVPTPYNGTLDLSVMDDAVSNVVNHLVEPENQLIVIKSTVWAGTTESYQKKYPNVNFAFNPEFLRDKTANEDFIKTDRQVVGFTSKTKDHPLIKELMAILPPAPFQAFWESAEVELVKYAANTYLALQVVFANQIYDFCQSAGADYAAVSEAVRSDHRIGKSHWEIFHTESSLESTKSETYRGYGGKCFPKDMNSMIVAGKELGVDLGLFEAGHDVNLELNGGKYDK